MGDRVAVISRPCPQFTFQIAATGLPLTHFYDKNSVWVFRVGGRHLPYRPRRPPRRTEAPRRHQRRVHALWRNPGATAQPERTPQVRPFSAAFAQLCEPYACDLTRSALAELVASAAGGGAMRAFLSMDDMATGARKTSPKMIMRTFGRTFKVEASRH